MLLRSLLPREVIAEMKTDVGLLSSKAVLTMDDGGCKGPWVRAGC